MYVRTDIPQAQAGGRRPPGDGGRWAPTRPREGCRRGGDLTQEEKEGAGGGAAALQPPAPLQWMRGAASPADSAAARRRCGELRERDGEKPRLSRQGGGAALRFGAKPARQGAPARLRAAEDRMGMPDLHPLGPVLVLAKVFLRLN